MHPSRDCGMWLFPSENPRNTWGILQRRHRCPVTSWVVTIKPRIVWAKKKKKMAKIPSSDHLLPSEAEIKSLEEMLKAKAVTRQESV